MAQTILHNLIEIGWAMLIFLCAYLSNMTFSLYYNIKVLTQPYDEEKIRNSAIKVLTFAVGLTLLCVSITALPIFADQVGWSIPEEYVSVFGDIVIIGAVLLVTVRYIKEAFSKLEAILNKVGE